MSVHGKKVFPSHQPCAEYSGGLNGVEYLYSQSGIGFRPKEEEDLDTQVDEGFGDIEEALPDGYGYDLHTTADSDDSTVGPLTDTESEDQAALRQPAGIRQEAPGVEPGPCNTLKGRFGRTKRVGGHVNAMKR